MGDSKTVLRSEPRPGVVMLTISRPEKLNALNAEVVESLHDHVRDIRRDGDCRALVLTGDGRGFCAGLDLTGYDDPDADDLGPTHQIWRIQRHLATLIQEVRRLPQPVVARVNGPAAGGGFALVCASDVRIAATPAVFCTSFIRLGVTACDLGTSWLLPRLVGAGRAHELLMTARKFDSAEALRIGLLADVVEPDALDARVDQALDSLLAAPPLSMSLTKQGMWMALEIPSFDTAVEMENRQQALTFNTEDAVEARATYRNGGTPAYRNR